MLCKSWPIYSCLHQFQNQRLCVRQGGTGKGAWATGHKSKGPEQAGKRTRCEMHWGLQGWSIKTQLCPGKLLGSHITEAALPRIQPTQFDRGAIVIVTTGLRDPLSMSLISKAPAFEFPCDKWAQPWSTNVPRGIWPREWPHVCFQRHSIWVR